MDDIRIYSNDEFGDVRVVYIEDKPWFVGKDVAGKLGYSNPQKAIRDHVDEEDKTVNESFTVNGTAPILINESGIYSLILSSKLPSAKRFKHWVTDEVLPSIRKHQMYISKQRMEEFLTSPDTMIAVLNALKEERAQKEALQEEMEKAKPILRYADIVLKAPGIVPVKVIADDYGISATAMNRLLHKLGIQYKQGTVWHLYKDYLHMGYSKTITGVQAHNSHVYVYTGWTQTGRMFIYELLKEKGILPVIEQDSRLAIESLMKVKGE